jgi:PTS system mannose-specific IIA component
MLKAAQGIVGEIPRTRAMSAVNSDAPDVTSAKIEEAFAAVNGGAGVLFLVDLHGSTPANLCLNFMDGSHEVEVLCGLNMAMLIKLATCDRRGGPRDLAELLQATGRRSIRLGSEITGRFEKVDDR